MSSSLVHDALIYGSDEEYVSHIVPFVNDGVKANQGVVVATNDRNREILMRGLGSRAESVVFVPSSEVYRSPISAVVAYDSVLARFRQMGFPSVRGIGEVVYTDSENWLRYEPIAHEVFQDAPLHVICPYDTRVLPERLINHARDTHPHVHGAVGSPDRGFVGPTEKIRELPERLSVEIPDSVALSLRIGRDLASARRVMRRVFDRYLPEDRPENAVLAVCEILANGIAHGEGSLDLTLSVDERSVVCRVKNEGAAITDPFIGFRPPKPEATSGMGTWIARQLSDEIQFAYDDRGPVVTLVFYR